MHLLQCILICVDTPVEDCRWVVDFRLSDRIPRKLTLGALQSPRLLERMTLCHLCAGPVTSCKLRDTKLRTILCTRTTNILSLSRKMESLEQQACQVHLHLLFLHYNPDQLERAFGCLVPYRRYDKGLCDQAPSRRIVFKSVSGITLWERSRLKIWYLQNRSW